MVQGFAKFTLLCMQWFLKGKHFNAKMFWELACNYLIYIKKVLGPSHICLHTGISMYVKKAYYVCKNRCCPTVVLWYGAVFIIVVIRL